MATPSHTLIVRPAGRDDAQALARLWFELRVEEGGQRDPERSERDLAPFHALASRRCREETSLLLVAYRGGRPVGFYCGRIRGGIGEGLDLYVVPGARRQRIGTTLVLAALDWYVSRGAVRLTGALRGGAASRAFWATVWEAQPSRLRRAPEKAGHEWRDRLIGSDGTASGDQPRLQGHPTSQPNS